jgi:uncharacterized protein YebE (UPF0316 family)
MSALLPIDFFNTEIWKWVILPLLIFIARIFDVSIGTMRIIFIAKGRKYIAPVLGFFEVLIWLMAIGQIMKNLSNPINYIAYASGFATGTFAGIFIEGRLAMGMALIRIITKMEASELLNHLRSLGLTVTSLDAEGNRGPVKVLFTVVKRKEINDIVKAINDFNPNAFYTVEDLSQVNQAYMPAFSEKRKRFKIMDLKRI